MPRGARFWYALALATSVCAVVGATPATATDLGGVADVRKWAAAPVDGKIRPRLRVGLPPLAPALRVQRKRLVAPSSHVFRYFGAHMARATDAYSKGFWAVDNVTGNQPPWFAAFRTNARTFDIAVKGANAAYRLRVDGHVGPVQNLPTTFKPYLVRVKFRRRRMRTVTLEVGAYFNGQVKFGGIVVPTRARLRRPRLTLGPRTIVLGDSFVVGVGTTIPFKGLSQSAGWALGLGDVWASGFGGTGYLSRGRRGTGANYLDRLKHDVVRWRPENVIVTGGGNDFAQFSADEVRTAAEEFFRQLRAMLPEAHIIAVAPFRHSTRRSIEALRQAAETARVPFIDPSGWITGTGNSGEPHGDGNADRYIGPASTNYHPTQEGYEYLGHELAEAIQALPG
jgi:lysophospholipase L1-like esterase